MLATEVSGHLCSGQQLPPALSVLLFHDSPSPSRNTQDDRTNSFQKTQDSSSSLRLGTLTLALGSSTSFILRSHLHHSVKARGVNSHLSTGPLRYLLPTYHTKDHVELVLPHHLLSIPKSQRILCLHSFICNDFTWIQEIEVPATYETHLGKP